MCILANTFHVDFPLRNYEFTKSRESNMCTICSNCYRNDEDKSDRKIDAFMIFILNNQHEK